MDVQRLVMSFGLGLVLPFHELIKIYWISIIIKVVINKNNRN